MLYQLAKDKSSWKEFATSLKKSHRSLELGIEASIKILAKLERIDNVEDMTVILCVDGLQKLVNDGTKTCDFYRVLTSICTFLNSSRAFALCICSATVQMPISQALADSPQNRVFLIPPPLRGHEVLATRTRLTKQLVDDMGGHGRALEALVGVLSNYTTETLEETDPAELFDQVHQALERMYGNVFDFPKKLGEVGNFNEHLTRSVLSWQRFEQFVAFFRRVKSVAYCEIPVFLSEFHTGARFGAIKNILITEPSPRTVVEAIHQEVTKSSPGELTCFTNRHGTVNVSDMDTIVINGASASAGDLFMRVQLRIGGQQVQCNEVIQCKLLQSNQKVNEDTYLKEREKAVNESTDVFLLITQAHATEFVLPPRCGIVSVKDILDRLQVARIEVFWSHQILTLLHTMNYVG